MEKTALQRNHVHKKLAVFDFDHTMIDNNADTAVMSLIDKKTIPKKIKELHQSDGWTAFMQALFQFMHEKGVDKSAITALIENLRPVEGIPSLLTELNKSGHDIIIISDCNSYFIDVWLQKNNLKNIILRVLTNPAEFDKSGLLKISMFHLQDYCKLSTKNLCKGQVLEDFLEEQKMKHNLTYDKVIYCGDGINDFCPILRLKEGDLACVRKNYKCVDLINKAKKGESFDNLGKPHLLKSEVFLWDNAIDILTKLKLTKSI